MIKKKGEIIGYIGDYNENGTWPPHLHFQIIEDLRNQIGDYPGVASEAESDFYLTNCPDPSIIFNLA
jgi:hypothetical protein